MPPPDEIREDMLDAVETLKRPAVRGAEVVLVHRAGNVDSENEIACGSFVSHRLANPLRTG